LASCTKKSGNPDWLQLFSDTRIISNSSEQLIGFTHFGPR
jgi:hypothetical protein